MLATCKFDRLFAFSVEALNCALLRLFKFMQQEFRLRGKPDVDVLLATSYLHKEVVQFLSHSTALKDEDAIVEAYANLVRKGMPFEIVDGEHLHFPQAFLRKLFNSRCLKKFMQKKPLEVCSTIGPQSSGKSTLSNHLYGSRFWGVSCQVH